MIGIRVLFIVCIGFIFSLGIMLIDYGSSLKCVEECGYGKMILQSLIFYHIEPRVSYHLGLLLVVGCFLTMIGMYLYDFFEVFLKKISEVISYGGKRKS